MPNKTINVFGCSWSSGVSNIGPYTNWVQKFAKIMPDYTVRNFSLPGISNKMIYFLYRTVNDLENPNIESERDINIFQYTSGWRETLITDESESLINNLETNGYLLSTDNAKEHYSGDYSKVNAFERVLDTWTDNYRELSRGIAGITEILPSTKDENLTTSQKKIRDNYFPNLNATMEMYATQCFRDGVLSDPYVDVMMFHRTQYDGEEFHKKNLTLQNYISEKTYNSFIEDNGGHFGEDGQIWEAELVKKTLIERNII